MVRPPLLCPPRPSFGQRFPETATFMDDCYLRLEPWPMSNYDVANIDVANIDVANIDAGAV